MEDKITGVMIYYYFICKRKLWYFCHQITMEDGNENVQLGKLLDENSYARDDTHINIDDALNIDFIREKKELHEVKKSKAIEEAGIWQLKYYLYYLKKRGVEGLTGKIDYPLAKRNIEIELTDEDCRELDKIIDDINKIKEYKLPPELNETKICKKCAYFDMCFIYIASKNSSIEKSFAMPVKKLNASYSGSGSCVIIFTSVCNFRFNNITTFAKKLLTRTPF